MERALKSGSFLFMVACACLVRATPLETTSSDVVAALRPTSLVLESEGVRNGGQGWEFSEWDSTSWGPQPDPSNAAALLLHQFSGGKSHLSLQQFQALLQCLRAGTHCPAHISPAFLALSNCTSNTALPYLQCRAFNKCLSRSEVQELYEHASPKATLGVPELEQLLPSVVAQLRQCRTSPAAVKMRLQEEEFFFSSRRVDESSVNVTDSSPTIEPGKKKPSQGEVWGFGILFVTLISVCSLVGVSVLPLMARAMYQQIMTGLIGLAVGSLAASAAFHLLPQAYNLPQRYGNHDYLFMSLYFLVGLWAFLMIERLIKICIMSHSARRHQTSVVKASPSALGIVHSGSDELPSPCPSVTVLSMRPQVACDPKLSCTAAAESRVDEMNRRNSSYYNATQTKPCGGYGAHDCLSHQPDHCCIVPENDANTCEELSNTVFCGNACCKNHAYLKNDTHPGILKELKTRQGISPSRKGDDFSADVSHLGCSSDVSRSCSNDISCAGVGCKPLQKEEVDLIFASQHQAIKASFGHEQKPAAGGHSHAAVEYHPGESSVIRTVAWMIIFGDGFHNFLDGVSIGAAFSVNKMTGISVSLAVMCEELPHELGDFAVLLNAGMSMKQALMYNFLSATTCYAGLVLGILLGEFTSDNSFIFALAAGMFIYISCVDMVPELNEVMNTACEKGTMKDVGWIMLLQNLGLILGAGSLFALAYFQDQIVVD